MDETPGAPDGGILRRMAAKTAWLVMAAVSVETRDLPECRTTLLVQTCCTTLEGVTDR